MNLQLYILSILFILLLSSCKIKEGFVTSAPPIQPFFTEQVGVSFYSPPPIMMPVTKTIDEIEVSSQYFKIVVSRVLDNTGKLESVKNLLDEQFTTALFETKRFTVMDKQTTMNLWDSEYKTNLYISHDEEETKETTQIETTSNSKPNLVPNEIKPNPSPDITNQQKTSQSSNSSASDLYGRFEYFPKVYEAYLDTLSQYTDGILKIIITGNDEDSNKIDIDYRIISSLSHNTILYSGKGKIEYSLVKGTTTKLLKRKYITDIVEDIKQEFPNPEANTWKIIQMNDKNNSRKITVDAGQNENIKEGMIGYVVKDVGRRTAFRAMFEVTEVFPKAFNAELKVEDPVKLKDKNILPQDYAQYSYLLNTIKVGDYVRMK